nr:hypothetical protein [Saprospiraceae bacterium]
MKDFFKINLQELKWIYILISCSFAFELAGQTFPGGGFILPPGKSITIAYDVDVTNGVCIGGGDISNQAIVSGSNFLTLITDDPDIVGSPGPTLTAISSTFAVFAGNDTTVCGSNTSFQLNGIVSGSISNGTWSGGTGTFSPNNTTLNGSYVFSQADTIAGFVELILSADDPADACDTIRDTIRISFDSPALVDAGPDQTVCACDTIVLSATLSGLATGGVWQKNMSFGTFPFGDTNPMSSYVLNATGKQLSSLSFGFMTNDPAGVCLGGLDTVTIFIDPAAIM